MDKWYYVENMENFDDHFLLCVDKDTNNIVDMEGLLTSWNFHEYISAREDMVLSRYIVTELPLLEEESEEKESFFPVDSGLILMFGVAIISVCVAIAIVIDNF